MFTDLSRVHIHRGRIACLTVNTTHVHHRDFPEIWTEGGSAAEATGLLISKLSMASETTPSDWQRSAILQAICDVRELLGELCADDIDPLPPHMPNPARKFHGAPEQHTPRRSSTKRGRGTTRGAARTPHH
jgi:hypothetical protein